jgi:hypothetical protein
MTDQLPTQITPTERLLTAAEFQRLADVPPEVEWFANITNRSTRRAYENASKDFMRFTGIFRRLLNSCSATRSVSAFRMSIEPCGSCATTTCSQIAAAVIGLLATGGGFE